MRIWWLAGVLFVLLAVGVAACGGDEAAETDDDDGDTTEPEDGDEGDEDGDDGDEPAIDRDATLRVAHVTPPTQWDPHLGRSGPPDHTYHTPVYDSLLELTPELELGPQLATEWEVSEDGLTYTFTLREDVDFHDGEHFDADAAVTNLERARDLDGSIAQQHLANVEAIEAVDEYTLRLELAERNPTFLYHLAMDQVGRMVSPAALEDPEALATDPVGSGLYDLVEQTEDRAIYERVPGYWDAELDARAPERLENIAMFDDEARYRAVETGELDLAMTMSWRPELDELGEQDGFNVHLFPGGRDTRRAHLLGFDLDHPQLSDPRVRTAINLALDREGMQSLVGAETCTPSASPFAEDVYPEAHAAVNEAYSYDPDRARELLEEAGATDLSINMIAITVLPMLNDLAVAVQAQLAEVGIEVNIDAIGPAEAAGTWTEGNHDAYIFVLAGNPDTYQSMERWYDGTMTVGTVPEEFGELVGEANLQPLGSDERHEGFTELGLWMAENDPVLAVICEWPVGMVWADHVEGALQQSYGQLQTVVTTRYLAVREQ